MSCAAAIPARQNPVTARAPRRMLIFIVGPRVVEFDGATLRGFCDNDVTGTRQWPPPSVMDRSPCSHETVMPRPYAASSCLTGGNPMNRRLFALFPVVALMAACASQPVTAPVSVADTIARDPQLSTLDGLVRGSGLADTLKAGGPYTLFAPTNEAFKAVPAKTMDELVRNPA